MIKPVGASCNLDCGYCYYADKGGRYASLMPESLLERCLREFLETSDVPEPSVCWHGGEPLLAGIDFFQKALEIEKYHGGGRRVINTIQTNGVLLDEGWSRFFADNGFLVGVSLDGPQDLHDALRRNHRGKGSFDAAMHALELLKDAGCEVNTLSVVHDASLGRGAEVYRFLRDIAGSRFIQFIPVERFPLNAKGYGKFLCDIFDVWAHGDIGKVFVQTFDATLARWCSCTGSLCTMGDTCGENLSVECNGDVFACDHFSAPEHLLGNLKAESLSHLYDSSRHLHFMQAKTQHLPAACRSCRWLRICHGGCPAQRNSSGENRLCEGLKAYFEHVAPAMHKMKALLVR